MTGGAPNARRSHDIGPKKWRPDFPPPDHFRTRVLHTVAARSLVSQASVNTSVLRSSVIRIVLLSLPLCLCITSPASAYNAQITWSSVAGVAGYKLYVRQANTVYGAGLDMGAGAGPSGNLTYVATGLPSDATSYLEVTSYTAAGVESARSNELSVVVNSTPGATPTAVATVGAGAGACSNATVIPPSGGTFTGATTGTSTLQGTCSATDTAPERVFQWTPSASGVATIQTCSATATTFDTVLYMRTGSCDTGTQTACNDDTTGCGTTTDPTDPHRGSRLSPTVIAGQTYYIVVDGYAGNSGSFALTVLPPAGSTPTPTFTAVRTATAPAPTTTPTPRPSSTPTRAFTATSRPSNTPTATSTRSVPTATPTLGATGACGRTTFVPANGGTFSGTTSGSSTLQGTCSATDTAPEQVFQWTPSVSGVATIQTCSSTLTTFDTVLYMRSGSCSGGTQMACNDDTTGCGTTTDLTNPHRGSRLTPTVTAGQTYYIVVDGYAGNSGSFSLTIVPPGGSVLPTLTSTVRPTATSTTKPTTVFTATPTATPTATMTPTTGPAAAQSMPDTCSAARSITALPYTNTVMTNVATTDASDPYPACGGGSRLHSVWYRFTAATTGTVTANTFGSNYDTILSVYTGSCGALVPVASGCNDDANGTVQSQVSFSTTAGTTYFVMVTAYSGTGGSLVLNLR